ncbi:MAG: hypothetical protein ACPMAQ_14915 [Phycisphaerae bacterium]
MAIATLQRRIDEAARHAGRIGRWSAWLQGATYLLVVALALGTADLLVPLPAALRRTTAIVWLLGWGAVIAAGVLSGMRARRRPSEAFAILLERGQGIAHNALVNGVQFSRVIAAGRTASASLTLMRAQIEQSQRVANDVAAASCVDRKCLRRRGLGLALVVLFTGATGAIRPGVWGAVAPRFYDPAGDHPPFCRTQFTVRCESSAADGRIARGDDVNVIVDLTGEAPDQVWLMPESDGAATAAGRIELFRRSESRWFARLDGLREDLIFRVHTPHGYSKRQYLRLATIPRIVAVRVQYAPPVASGRAPYEAPLDRNGIREEQGTLVTLTLTSDRPLRQGEVRFADGRSLTAAPLVRTGAPRASSADEPAGATACKVRAAFVLEQDGHLAATVTDADGVPSRDRIDADIRVIGAARESPTTDDGQQTSDRRATAAPDTVPRKTAQGATPGARNPVTASRDEQSPAARESAGPAASAARPPHKAPPPIESPRPREGTNLETIRPDEPLRIDAGTIPDERMPGRYRDLTEAYFRRLAEDGR